jgi:DNA-binding XRE family transcriptional regulator
MLREELPTLRAKAKISQEELAQKIGVSRQTYSSIETGKRDKTWTTFMTLIVFFQNCELTENIYKYMDGIEGKMNIILEKA